MNFIIRKFRRWKYSKDCASCQRKFMWKHNCKDIQKKGAQVFYAPSIHEMLEKEKLCPTKKQ